ncbi:hypothetical protein LTS15_010089 [Exophiala xenobiotica]|nr:hypothetical protein LTS15_010089 [Exophiala xenobiotica]
MHDPNFKFQDGDVPDITVTLGQMTITGNNTGVSSTGRPFEIIASPYSDDDPYWNEQRERATDDPRLARYRRIVENHLDGVIVQWASDDNMLPAPPIDESWVGELSVVRVLLLNDRAGLELDKLILHHVFIPSVIRLNDGSWELLIRARFMDHVHLIMRSAHSSWMIQEEYDPINPLARDLEVFGQSRAEALAAIWFQERVRATQVGPYQIPHDFYTYLYLEKRSEVLRRLAAGSVTYMTADGQSTMAIL